MKEFQTNCKNYSGFDKDLCVLKNKWINYVPSQSFPESDSVSVKEAYFQYSLDFDVNERLIIPSSNHWNDCHGKERKTQRPVPNECYGNTYRENWESTKLWLWEVRADLMYTFDNVLWDEKLPDRKENQFWYLMLYLKTLVTLIENPIDIVDIVSYRRNDNMADLDKRVRDLEHKLPLLSSAPVSQVTITKDNIAIKSELSDYTVVTDKTIKIGEQIKP